MSKTFEIYGGRWMPSPFSFKVQSPALLDRHAKVRDLILDSGKWNFQLIRDSFLHFEAEKILSLARPQKAKQDRIMWHFDKRGIYTVISGYEADPSRPHGEAIWQKIWNMKIQPKIKVFLWRACQEIIPTKRESSPTKRGNLAQQHVSVAPECPIMWKREGIFGKRSHLLSAGGRGLERMPFREPSQGQSSCSTS